MTQKNSQLWQPVNLLVTLAAIFVLPIAAVYQYFGQKLVFLNDDDADGLSPDLSYVSGKVVGDSFRTKACPSIISGYTPASSLRFARSLTGRLSSASAGK